MAEEKTNSGFVGGLTEKEVRELENKFFMVRLGKEILMDENGVFAFTEKVAKSYQESVRSSLAKSYETGTEDQRQGIREMIGLVLVIPLRIQ